jgi:hypothetical protein
MEQRSGIGLSAGASSARSAMLEFAATAGDIADAAVSVVRSGDQRSFVEASRAVDAEALTRPDDMVLHRAADLFRGLLRADIWFPATGGHDVPARVDEPHQDVLELTNIRVALGQLVKMRSTAKLDPTEARRWDRLQRREVVLLARI